MYSRFIFRSWACIALVFLNASPGIARSCDSIQSAQELYDCALEKHPDVKSASVLKEAARAAKEKATQLPNPELTVKSVSAENAGEKVGGTEVTLSLSLTDLLVKRTAFRKSGQVEEKALIIQAEEQEFKAKSRVLRDLFRYRQVLDEDEVVDEALGAFQKIERLYRTRRARGPEQDITLNLVRLAQGDYELRRNHLAVEKAEIEARMKGIFGGQFEFKKNLLPLFRTSWPKLEPGGISKNTFELRKLEAERDKMESEKNLANADSWPKIAAGPVSERVTQGLHQYTQYGFTVTVGVPILSQNGGGRELAGKNLAQAQLQYDYASKKADFERDLLIQKYQSAVETLKKSDGDGALKHRHAQIDAYFRRGLTTSSTVIEAHRQITEFTESQHEHEMAALESLMALNLLSGKDPREVLR